MGIYEMDTKNFNSKNLVYYYYENLIKPKKLETWNTLIDKKAIKPWWIILLDIALINHNNIKSVFWWINRKDWSNVWIRKQKTAWWFMIIQ